MSYLTMLIHPVILLWCIVCCVEILHVDWIVALTHTCEPAVECYVQADVLRMFYCAFHHYIVE